MKTMSRFVPAVILSLASCVAHAEAEWPTRVATVEEMKMLSPIRIRVPASRPRGEVRGPAVLRVHVDTEGKVRRAVLVESCGSSGHDEAALHAMRSVRFAPTLVDGEPAEVTLVLPLHLPLAKKENS
jgi:TonB family protein